ncbi:unnamed protein product [Dibothriocephalus latus]|uniref:Uncharacterized protein n=1 Tax=Dibothriocephalus latus TaxID=60516 RepID=A0A3P6T6K9_DIBLA|nr:unnamed protein product [Dibothriocephalus latus]
MQPQLIRTVPPPRPIRQKARLAQLDEDIKRNEDLVAWYKLADEMNDIKGWADAKSADLREALDGKQAPRTPHEQNTQRQKHERICNDIERKEPRVKELLDPKICPMPACLQKAGIPGSDPRPELAESVGELKRLASERSKQLLASVDTTDLLSRLADVAEQINSTTVAVDALVEGQSAFPLASSAKKLKGIEETVQKMEPVINDLSQQVDQKLATMQHDRSTLSKPLKKGRKHVIDALQDLKDRISAAKFVPLFEFYYHTIHRMHNLKTRSLVLQNWVADFMQLSEDQQEDITKALAFASSANVGNSSDPNRWQVFVEDLPNLLSRIDECIGEGTDLRNDLVQPYGTNAGNVAVMPVRRKKDLSQPENPFYLSPQEFATPLQMEYPLCSEQSAQTAADQVKEQIDSLTRDRQLLQKEVQAGEDRKENAKLFSSFNEDWVDIMERIQEKDAHLTALAAIPPKSQSLLKGQVSKHEVLEAEVVHIKQRASEVEQAGSDLLTQLRAPGEGQSGQAQEAQKVRDKLSALEKALQALEDKLAQRRKCLNECDRYLRFCQQVSDFILWCNDLDHEVALTEGAVKASSHIITGAVNRLVSPAAPTAGTGLSIDLNQAEQQSSTYERLNDEMRTKWSPLSTALVQEAEDMINLNHYAAADLNAKVEQLLVAQKRAEEGLKSANLRMPQLIDLLHLRREIAALVSQLAAQPARLQALVKECSSSSNLQGGQCDKLTSSAEDCADLMASLDRCSRQLTWEEEARDIEGWLNEREAELAELSRPKAEVTMTGDVILEQLNTLKRQETFQNSVSANSSHAEGLIKRAKELIAEENKVTNNPNSAVSQRLAERLERINQRWKALLASCAAIAATLNQSRDLLDYQREAEALERWLRDKDILLAKSDLGSDYDHCISLKDKAKEAAAGKTLWSLAPSCLELMQSSVCILLVYQQVNKQTMQAFDDLSRKVSKALRTATGGASSGGAASVAALNQRTADYIDRWTADIQDRWRRIAEQLAAYVALLDLASGIHELLSRYNVLLSETQDRKTRAAALDDLAKAQSAAELQAILRVCARGERDIAAIDDHAHGLAAEAKKTVDRVTASSKDGRLQPFVDNLKRKPVR